MKTDQPNPDTSLWQALRAALLHLAQQEEARAADEAARIPYWSPVPSSVVGHRAAALALRSEADRLRGGNAPVPDAA